MARAYNSDRREQQSAATKRAVIDAARELFLEKGWAATGMREVATNAGVALETVYAHFTNKRGLLRAVGDEAAVGDAEPVALAARPEFQAIGQGRRQARVTAAARLLTAVHQRTASVAILLRQAAPADAEVAEMLRSTRERQRADIAQAIKLILGRKPAQADVDGVWAIASPEVYLLLVEESGWPPEQFELWFAEMLDRALPRS